MVIVTLIVSLKSFTQLWLDPSQMDSSSLPVIEMGYNGEWKRQNCDGQIRSRQVRDEDVGCSS